MPRSSTRGPLQAFLLGLYAAVRRLGVFETRLGLSLFEHAYDLYKRWIEGANVNLLQPFATPGMLVFDVGANVGFFTVRLAHWVGPSGRVVAIEPENRNLARLRKRLQTERLTSLVEVVAAAATDRPGKVNLDINPDHPGDHRLGQRGLAVGGVTLDQLAAAHGWRPISLIKIDVQGAEAAVVAGAREVFERFGPALYIEVDDRNLLDFGSSAAQLMDVLADFGYVPYSLRDGTPRPTTRQDILAQARAQYVDVLFLKNSGPLPPKT